MKSANDTLPKEEIFTGLDTPDMTFQSDHDLSKHILITSSKEEPFKLELTEAVYLTSTDWTFLSVNKKEQGIWPVQGKELIVIGDFLIVPRVLYHQEEEMYHFLEETILLRKREVITAAGQAIIRHYMDDVLVCAPTDDVLSHALDLTINALIAAGFELQEEKVQRMPPWKYLGLEINKRTTVPQKLAIKTKECESEFNTPIFPVKKPNGKYRLVQDLRAINKIVKDIHPVVANPYTLLTSVSEKFKWFSVVDLKDAFFCIPLALESRKYFAFEWESPDTGRKRQLTWSRLPQGFKNSPTIFGNQLAKELEEWKTTEVRESPLSYVILQYVDDIFLATEEKETCLKLTIALLNMLGQAGYRVSKEKAQLLKESVIYLGCEITQGQRRLGVNRVEAICAIPLPRNHQELRSFLGMVGWCRLWILNFGLIAKPLYEALKEPRLNWDRQRKKAFEDLKQALKEAPALGLPDLNKDFQLYVNERQKLALGVLAQRLGSWKRPVGYFSKQLDAVSAGWPSCLWAVTATVILIQEARKLTLGRKIEVFVPHMVLAVLEQKGGHWLSSSRLLQYQAILREQDDVDLKMTNHINPAEFLRSEQEEGELAHDCMEVIEQVYASRIDLKDVPMENPDWELFTDGSSFVESGTRYAGYAVVTATTVVEAKALTPGTSAQRAEIIGLTRALMLSSGKKVNIWTDSKYAFGVVHIHGALWKERGLLNSQGTAIKYRTEILALLDAVHQPEKVAVMHVRGHQKEEGKIYQGNRLADITARRVSREVWTQMALIPTKVSPVTPHLIQEPKYSPDDEKLASLLLAQKNATGWYVTIAATEPVVDVINGIDVNLTCSVVNDQKTEVQNIQATRKKGANIVTVWDKDARRAKVQRRRVTRQVMEGTGQPEIETDLDRKGHENLVVGLIRDFGMVQNSTDSRALNKAPHKRLRLFVFSSDRATGGEELSSPRALTPEAEKALERIQDAMSSRQAHRFDPELPFMFIILGKLPHLHGMIFQWKDIPKKDRDRKDPLSIIEWVFLSHHRSKRMTRPQELVAELIRKARFRIRELAGCDFTCVHIPIGL
ncbi:hypothetical protein DUI87_13662 [Hirundo rustica rustica]|uniref:ribonuclease H n=1 Tax=Hirundo rustica rustica TaxID=333673 RepID=A0A3M0K9U5_HIRRU|nr:hypothetical protein DUI87_13662 [Hirundo rustica rustica]